MPNVIELEIPTLIFRSRLDFKSTIINTKISRTNSRTVSRYNTVILKKPAKKFFSNLSTISIFHMSEFL